MRRLYGLPEEKNIREDLLAVLTTTRTGDEKVRSKIPEDLRTPTLDDTVQLLEQVTFAKDTNTSIEKLRQGSAVAAVVKRNSKTLYQK